MKKIAFVLVILSSCFISDAQEGSSKDLYITKSFKEASYKKIIVETKHGNISVSSISTGDTKIEVYIHSNSGEKELSKEEIQKKLDEYYFLDIFQSGDALNAIVKPKKDFPNIKTSLTISFVIYAAKSTSAELHTKHGNVALSGMNGNQDMMTKHGNIRAENITGKLTAQSSHGNVSVTEVKNEIDIKTHHGNIDAKNCEGTVMLNASKGNVELKNSKGKIHAETDHGNVAGHNIEGDLSAITSHGDVSLDNLSCSVETSTDHGNIALSFDKITGDIVVGNSKGNVFLEIPKSKGIDLDLQGKSLNIDAMDNFSGSKEKKSIKGTLNGGGTKLKAISQRGRVSVNFK